MDNQNIPTPPDLVDSDPASALPHIQEVHAVARSFGFAIAHHDRLPVRSHVAVGEGLVATSDSLPREHAQEAIRWVVVAYRGRCRRGVHMIHLGHPVTQARLAEYEALEVAS